MAAFTVSVDRKFHDAFFAGRTGADSYTLSSGVTLTVDGDVRYGPNTAATTGAIGTVATSPGARLFLDARAVRLVPFNSGSGTVPIADTVIFQAGTGGKLLGVYASINTPPLAAGSAMPSTGFIKIREQAGPRFSAGPIFNIGASATGPDVQGWIEAVFAGTTFSSNPGFTFETVGDLFELTGLDGQPLLTNGSRGQTMPLPGSVANAYHVGVWIETAPGSGVFRAWASAQDLVDSAYATDERARVVWCNADTGVLTFGSDGTNNVGMLPPAGCRVRVPSVIVTGTNSTIGYGSNLNLTSTSVTHFPSFQGTLSKLKLTSCAFSGQLAISTNSRAYSIDIQDSSIVGKLSLYAYLDIITSGMVVAPPKTTYQVPGGAYVHYAIGCGGTHTSTDDVLVTIPGTSVWPLALEQVNLNSTRLRVQNVHGSTIGGGGIGLTSGKYIFQDPVVSGLPLAFAEKDIAMRSCSIKNLRYSSTHKGTVPASGNSPAGLQAVFRNQYSADPYEIDGLSWLVSDANTCHPFGGYILNGTAKVFKNIGTWASPLPGGTVNPVSMPMWQMSQAAALVRVQNIFVSPVAVNQYASIPSASQKFIRVGSSYSVYPPRLKGDYKSRYSGCAGSTPVGYDAVSGLVWGDIFLSASTGEIYLTLNGPPSPDGQVVVDSGSPKFLSTDALFMWSVGDQITWTSPYFIKGHGFPSLTVSGSAPNASTGSVMSTTILATFDVDTGAGFSGVFKAYTPANVAAADAQVNRVTGFRLRLRFVTQASNTLRITSVRLTTASSAADQAAVVYPESESTVSVTNLVTGSQVKATRVDTGAVLFTGQESGGSVSFTTDYTGQIAIEARKASGSPYYQPWAALATVTGDISITALQVRDDQ